MILVLDVDDAPAVLTASDLAAGNDDGLLGAYDGERDDVLISYVSVCEWPKMRTSNLDLGVECAFLPIKLVVVVRVHFQVVEGELLLYSLLEGHAFLQGQGVGFGDDRHHIDHIRELLQDDNVNWFKPVVFSTR